jgi:hypothetical protein
MVSMFSEMSLNEVEQILDSLGFKKLGEEKKKGSPIPYNLAGTEWRVLTYQHPTRREKIKITQMKGIPMVEVDCGKKQRTAWKKLTSVKELKQHFNL